MNLLTREDFETRYPARTASASALPFDRSAVLSGDLTLTSDVTMRGVVKGNVVVKSGVEFNFNGVIKGSLIVEPRATAYIDGVITRDLLLSGSTLLKGVIKGNVRPKHSGELHIEGVVKGRIVE